MGNYLCCRSRCSPNLCGLQSRVANWIQLGDTGSKNKRKHTAERTREDKEVKTMARYKMTVMFDVHEEVGMKYVYREGIDNDKVNLVYEPLKGSEGTAIITIEQPHINKLYEEVLERIETSLKHPITYDIVSFEKMKEE